MAADVSARMRDDWNRRAREDANYYVAFGRRNQDEDEFFATAGDQVHGFQLEFRRLAPAAPGSRRALEIGCGPGRLMRPLSPHFGEIHGVDVSDEMVRLARERLAGIAHAHVHHVPDSSLASFAGDSFDFVYSYAVFQHIPSREVVFGYLEEAHRVLKPGGVLRCQINGLPESAQHYDTWSGVRISAAEVKEFAARRGFQLLALEGILTQYMWATLLKPPSVAPDPPAAPTRIRRITNAHSSEPAAPVRGRFASISLWVEHLAPACDLNRLAVTVADRPGFVSYIGPPEHDGLRQVNVYLPEGLAPGLERLVMSDGGRPMAAATIRLIPPGPAVPRVVSVSDGIDLLSGKRIVTGSVKASVEEVLHPEEFRALCNGSPVLDLEQFCTDPRLPCYEFNFKIPPEVVAGPARLSLFLGQRHLGEVEIEIVSVQ